MGDQVTLDVMRYFITDKDYFKKIGEIVLILAFLMAGLYFYETLKYRLSNFEWYHVSAYLDLVRGRSLTFTNGDNARGAAAVPVLVYHGILSDKEYEDGGEDVRYVSTSYSRFRDQMMALKDAGWNTVSHSEFERFLSGEIELPKQSFLLTFDDARKDSFYASDPLLKSLGFNALIFVITSRSLGVDNQKSTYYLSEDELRKAVDTERWEVQSHGGDDHDYIVINQAGERGAFMSNKKWLSSEQRLETEQEFVDRISLDLRNSKAALENTFGIAIESYAFPFGDFGLNTKNYPESERITKEVSMGIYKNVFYQVSYRDSDIFNYPSNDGMVRRIKGDSSMSGRDLVELFEKNKPKTLPFEDAFNTDLGWKKNWGELKIESGKLTIQSTSSSTSAAASLAGTLMWSDYFMAARVSERAGQSVTLVGYYQNEEKYYACTYTNQYIKLQKRIDGEIVTIDEYKFEKELPEKVELSMGRSEDGRFSCGVDNELFVSEETMLPDQSVGQISLRAWDPEKGSVRLTVESISVLEGVYGEGMLRREMNQESGKIESGAEEPAAPPLVTAI